MTTQEQYIERLRELVEAKFGRTITTMEDCEELSAAVGEATNIRLDSRAFVPLFCDRNSQIAPRPVTLSALTRYLGYSSWGDFCTTSSLHPSKHRDTIALPRRWGVIILTIAAILVVITTILILLLGGKGDRTDARFEPLADSIEQVWVARTIEECNAVRSDYGTEEYRQSIDDFISSYQQTLNTEIANDLRRASNEQAIVATDARIMAQRDSIALRCKTMYEALYKELE